MRKLALVFTFTLFVVTLCLSGCFGGGSSSSNPVGPMVSQTPETETTGTTAASAGAASLGFRIIIPDANGNPKVLSNKILRANVNATAYASATLLLNGTIAQVKKAPVSNGEVNITFNNVSAGQTAKIILDLVGCNLGGATHFEGEKALVAGNNVIELTASYPAGSNRTSDGKLLIEIGDSDTGKITFNTAGQPIGNSYSDGWITNFETNEKLLDLRTVDTSSGIRMQDYAWFDGKLWLGGTQTITSYDVSTKVFTMYGDPNKPIVTPDNSTLDSNTTFKAVGDLQVLGDTLYIQQNYQTITTLKAGVLRSITTNDDHDEFSVTEDGNIYVCNDYDANGKPRVSRVDGSTLTHIGITNERNQSSVIKYKDGLLVACKDAIYYWNGSTQTQWLTPDSLGDSQAGHFYIYKNQSGVIYVCSEYTNKIWRVE